MANVLHKTANPIDYRESVHTPDFSESLWFHNPDISAVINVPTKYWRVGTNPVEEMNSSEKSIIDQTETNNQIAIERTGDKLEVDTRRLFIALIKVLIDEINILRTWTRDFESATAAASNLADFKTRVANLNNLNDRTAAQARTAILNEIDVI